MSKTITERMQNIDRRILYAILLICTVIPLLYPLGIPIGVSKYTKDIYDFIEELPPGSVVLLTISTSPQTDPSFGQGIRAVTQHVLNRPIKVIIVSLAVAGPIVTDDTFSRINVPEDKVYGVDWVNFGYIAGVEAALAGMASDTHATLSNDMDGTPVAELPIMNDIRTGADFDMAVAFTGDGANMEAHLRQLHGPYGVAVAAATESVGFSYRAAYYPYQLMGIINDTKGGSEYEQLLYGSVIDSSIGDAQSLVHMVLLILVAIGNIGYLTERLRG